MAKRRCRVGCAVRCLFIVKRSHIVMAGLVPAIHAEQRMMERVAARAFAAPAASATQAAQARP